MGRFEMQQRRIVEGLYYSAANAHLPTHFDDSPRPRRTPGARKPGHRGPGRQPELGRARTQLDDAQKAMQQRGWEKSGKATDGLKCLAAGPEQ